MNRGRVNRWRERCGRGCCGCKRAVGADKLSCAEYFAENVE